MVELNKYESCFSVELIKCGNKIVFIIRKDIKDAFKEAIGDRIEKI